MSPRVARALLVLAICLGLAHALSAPLEWEDEVMGLRKGWRRIEAAAPTDTMDITVALPLRHTNDLAALLMDVSDPTSPHYGQYYTQEAIYELTSPPTRVVKQVLSWLNQGQARQIAVRNNGGYITARVSIDKLSALMDGQSPECYRYRHLKETTQTIVRCPHALAVPTAVAPAIELIDGWNNFPYLQRTKRSTSRVAVETTGVSYYVSAGDSVAGVNVRANGTAYSMIRVAVKQSGEPQVQQYNTTLPSTRSPMESHQLVFPSLANYETLQVTVEAYPRGGNAWVMVTPPNNYPVFPSPFITPTVTNSLYSIPPGTRATNPQNSQAVAEFGGQYYSPTDLAEFSQLMGVPTPNVTVYGYNDPTKPRGESTLDIEWITAIGVNVPTYFWYVEHGFLLTWALGVAEQTNPPLVHSISYGEPEHMIRPAIADRVNQELQMLGMRGITVISTSGDLGSSDGTDVCARDVPDFPSSSPWTTSLGATYLTRNTQLPICQGVSVDGLPIYCDATSELPCAADAGSGFTTGGGFSWRYPRPAYQAQAVQDYLNTAQLPSNAYYNATGRGFNDVSALGSQILIYQGGQMGITGGTSASGPIFAAVLALLNDVQLNQGKSPLGFVNPWLYQVAAATPDAFNSVLSGSNRCRETSQACCKEGFSAQAGWNPLSGLGTPVFSRLQASLP